MQLISLTPGRVQGWAHMHLNGSGLASLIWLGGSGMSSTCPMRLADGIESSAIYGIDFTLRSTGEHESWELGLPYLMTTVGNPACAAGKFMKLWCHFLMLKSACCFHTSAADTENTYC